MTTSTSEPKGVICVLTDPKGNVWAVGHDFELGAPAGFDLKQAQEMRAERRCAYELANASMLGGVIVGFDDYEIANLQRRLLIKGWKLHTRYIGYDA